MTLAWMMWQLTSSETWLGFLAIFLFLPSIVFGPLFGVLVDRVNRSKAALLTTSIIMILAFILASVTHYQLTDKYILLFFSLLIGIANSAYQSIRLSFVPELVRPINMPKAVAINAIIFNSSRFIGPVIAGYLLKYHNNSIALYVVALSYIPLMLVLFKLKIKQLNPHPYQKKFTFVADIKAALNHISQSKLIFILFVMIATSAIFGRGLLEILPALAEVLYQGGIEQVTLFNSAAGLGAILAGLIMTKLSSSKFKTVVMLVSYVSGFILMLFPLTTHLTSAVLFISILSFCATVTGVISQSLIQVNVENAFRGRIMSLWGAINFGGGALGGLLFGFMTENVGYPVSFLSIGILCVLLAFYTRQHLHMDT